MRTLHVGLRVQSLPRSREFYTGIGYEVVGTVPDTPLGHLTMLKLPEDDFVSLELVYDPAGGPVDPGGFNHLVIQTRDLHDTIARLATRGIQVEAPSSPDGSEDFLTTWLTDPDGYRIELVQWPAGHADGMTRADFPEEPPPAPSEFDPS
jgi:lactoylglutathione lyase